MDHRKQSNRENLTNRGRARPGVTLRALPIGLAALVMICVGLLWTWRANRVQHERRRPALAAEDIGDRLGQYPCAPAAAAGAGRGEMHIEESSESQKRERR